MGLAENLIIHYVYRFHLKNLANKAWGGDPYGD